MSQLSGKVALVTGGGRGIGRGICLALARAGADVALSDVNQLASAGQQYETTSISGFDAAQKVAEEVRACGRRSLAIDADVTKKEQVARMIESARSALGTIDMLVCNAGVVSAAPVEALAEDTFDVTMAVNVKGVFLCCQAAIPLLRQRGGCIINIASVAGKNGSPWLAHYCASKFAVVGFTNSLAKELARDNIRVNAICPGILRTQMWEYLAEKFRGGDDKEAAWQRLVKTLIPLGRAQTPDDIGALAVYLASAENVTGQAINVDGGMEMHWLRAEG